MQWPPQTQPAGLKAGRGGGSGRRAASEAPYALQRGFTAAKDLHQIVHLLRTKGTAPSSMPVTRTAAAPPAAVVKAAGAAARARRSRNQMPSLREALPLLLLLLLLGLGGAAYVLFEQGWFGRMAKLISGRTSGGRTTAQKNAAEEIINSQAVRDALKGEGVGLAQQPAVADADVVKFKEQAVPLIHSFLFSKYDLFASSKLTFRDMKEHLSGKLGMPYEQLKADELSNVIEDAVDNVTNECRAGKTPRDECAAKIGFVL